MLPEQTVSVGAKVVFGPYLSELDGFKNSGYVIKDNGGPRVLIRDRFQKEYWIDKEGLEVEFHMKSSGG